MYHIKDVQVKYDVSKNIQKLWACVYDYKYQNSTDGEWFYFNELEQAFGWWRKSVKKKEISHDEFIERFGKEKKKIEPRAKQLPLITDEESIRTPYDKKIMEDFAKQIDEMGQIENQFNGIIGDPIVNSVIAKYDQRSRLGVSKYGNTLEDNTDGLEVFLTHLQEELMDATLYIEKLKKKVTQLKNIF